MLRPSQSPDLSPAHTPVGHFEVLDRALDFCHQSSKWQSVFLKNDGDQRCSAQRCVIPHKNRYRGPCSNFNCQLAITCRCHGLDCSQLSKFSASALWYCTLWTNRNPNLHGISVQCRGDTVVFPCGRDQQFLQSDFQIFLSFLWDINEYYDFNINCLHYCGAYWLGVLHCTPAPMTQKFNIFEWYKNLYWKVF